MLFQRLRRRPQHALSERDRSLNPVVDAIRPAVCHGAGHLLDQPRLHGLAVEMDDASNAAHGWITVAAGADDCKAA